MESLFRYTATPSSCGYLPGRIWSLEYDYVGALSPAEYLQRMHDGWRRFGTMMFRPACPDCHACRPLRVCVADFRADRSQRRCWNANRDANFSEGLRGTTPDQDAPAPQNIGPSAPRRS